KYGVQFPTKVTVDGKEYSLTRPGQGGDPAADSDPDQRTGIVWLTTPKSGNNSGEPGEADNPTIDAGYVLIDGLSVTGAQLGGTLVGGAALLLLGGAAVLLARRRRSLI